MKFDAHSISRSARERLERQPFQARVLAVFDRACNLVTANGDVIALVTPDIGDGPLNIVVDAQPGEFQSPGFLHEGHEGTPSINSSCSFVSLVDKNLLQIGELQIDLSVASTWEPRPDWNILRNLSPQVTMQRALARLASLAANSFTALAPLAALQAGWNGDRGQLHRAATQLAGLGSGLTPAGDDFLCGVMLRAWLMHPTPREWCREIVEVAAPRTTTLSAAFLRSAAQGECSAAWHRLLAALASGSDDELDAATRQVLAFGATSGADTLAGFLALSQSLTLGRAIEAST